jgi:hypothetical protein
LQKLVPACFGSEPRIALYVEKIETAGFVEGLIFPHDLQHATTGYLLIIEVVYISIKLLEIDMEIRVNFLKDRQLPLAVFTRFIPVVDLKCNENSDDYENDLSDRIAQVTEELPFNK